MNTTTYARLWAIAASLPTLSDYVTDSDFDYYNRRFLAEGLPFVTTILPAYGKAVERFHEDGIFSDPGGLELAEGSPFPRFLHKAWRAISVSELEDRELGNNWLARANATRAIRQLTLLFYKLEVEPNTTRRETWDKFVKTDSELASINLDASFKLREQLNTARKLLKRLLGRCPIEKLVGKHGSGASACGVKPAERYGSERVVDSHSAVFPSDLYLVCNEHHLEDIAHSAHVGKTASAGYYDPTFPSEPTRVEAMRKASATMSGWHWEKRDKYNPSMRQMTWSVGDGEYAYRYQYLHNSVFIQQSELSSKVSFVFKDSRAFRLICCEPRENMYYQQGLRALIESAVNSSPWAKDLDFRDQTRQQHLARVASIERDKATIDMRDASDKVYERLVAKLVDPSWMIPLSACRSTQATCTLEGDDGELVTETVRLNKFAPMGSATCFPVEQLVFWALCRAACPTWAHVSAFGDDIIVEVEFLEDIIQVLEAVGLEVNRNKSFSKGFLRESCGGYYLNGLDISIVQVKKPLHRDHDGIASACSCLNNLFSKYQVHGAAWGKFYPMFRSTDDGSVIVTEWEDVVEAYLCEEFGGYNIPFYDGCDRGHYVRETDSFSLPWPTPFVIIGNRRPFREEVPYPWPMEHAQPTSYATRSKVLHSRRYIKTYCKEPVRDDIPEVGWSLLHRWFSHRDLPETEESVILEILRLTRDTQDVYVPGLPLLVEDPCGYTLANRKPDPHGWLPMPSVRHTVATRLFKYVSRSVAIPG